MKRIVILYSTILLSLGYQLHGQGNLEEFLEANIQDAGRLTANYISPLIKGVGYGLNNGWYNTAKPHTMGFDLTITTSAVFVPQKDQYSDFVPSEYQDLELLSPADGRVPTVFGPDNVQPEYRIPSTGQTFLGPEGYSLENEFGFNAVPVPMVTLGIGVIPNLDLKMRFLPITDFSKDVEVKMWGVGALHKLNQYFPGEKELLVDVSFFGGYTHLRSDILLDTGFPGTDQIGAYDMDAWTLEGVVSYDLKIITFYGALGYNQVKTNIDVLGTYEVNSEILVDPISERFQFSGIRATAGFRLKVAIIALHADYSLNRYSALTVGFGFNVN